MSASLLSRGLVNKNVENYKKKYKKNVKNYKKCLNFALYVSELNVERASKQKCWKLQKKYKKTFRRPP